MAMNDGADVSFEFEGFDKLNRDLRRLASDLRSQKLMNRLGLASIRQVRRRTRKGTDVDGSPFEPYSDSHERRRAKEGLPTDHVTLKFDQYESMLDTLDHAVARDLESVVVEFTDAEKEEIAGYHNEGEGDNPEREFMAHSEKEVDELESLVTDHLDDVFDLANLS